MPRCRGCLVVGIEAAAGRAARLQGSLPGGKEAQDVLQQMMARARIRRESTNGVETLKGVLGGDIGMLRDERVVPDRRHDEPVAEAFRILEDQTVFFARHRGRVGREPALPEVEGGVCTHAPLDRVHHPGSGSPRRAPGYSKNVTSLPGVPLSSA